MEWTTYFACGCEIIRRDDGALISAIPCERHQAIGQGQTLADALEKPHIAVEVNEKLSVKSLFGGKP